MKRKCIHYVTLQYSQSVYFFEIKTKTLYWNEETKRSWKDEEIEKNNEMKKMRMREMKKCNASQKNSFSVFFCSKALNLVGNY
jgi:hypothetical protein